MSSTSIPVRLGPQLDPDEAQARVDVWYLRKLHGVAGPEIDRGELLLTVDAYARRGDTVYAWILSELARRAGWDSGLAFEERPFAQTSPLLDGYWLTHRVLFASDYLAKRLEPGEWGKTREALCSLAPWAIEQGHLDLGAELAIALQALQARSSAEHAALIAAVRRGLDSDGALRDESMGADWTQMADHATAAALVALAGAQE